MYSLTLCIIYFPHYFYGSDPKLLYDKSKTTKLLFFFNVYAISIPANDENLFQWRYNSVKFDYYIILHIQGIDLSLNSFIDKSKIFNK